MHIRDIRIDDKKEVFKMLETFYNQTNASLHTMNYANCEATFEECLRSSTYARMVVFEEEKNLIGFALLSFTWSNESGGMVVLIEEVFFDESARGKGYGSQFFTWLEETYHDSTRFRLEATYDNKGAIDLYKRLGYEELNYFQMVKDK